MKRKDFILGCTAGLSLLATGPLRVFSSPLPPSKKDQIFVVVFLRGGCDGLNLVGPSSDQVYQDARPDHLKVRESRYNPGLLLKNPLADIGFRLNPDAPELKELYDQGDLAILHACGLQNATRSHFVAMDLIERGLQHRSGSKQGWMSRYFDVVRAKHGLPAISGSATIPVAMEGFERAVNLTNPEGFDLMEAIRYPNMIQNWHQSSSFVDSAARRTLETIKVIKHEMRDKSRLAHVDYPEDTIVDRISHPLKTLASLIKLDLGMKIGQVDFGGWDTHENQHTPFQDRVRALSSALAAFYQDLEGYQDRLTVLVMSEFGRRLRANKSGGTDHGYGNMMMVLGKNVKGGQMYGTWPGLHTDNLAKGVDLAITTDYRAVLGEILQQRMSVKSLDHIFPDFQYPGDLGFLA